MGMLSLYPAAPLVCFSWPCGIIGASNLAMGLAETARSG
jgi:hypothetical protein